MSYDDWKTRAPDCDEEPCASCLAAQCDGGTRYCGDCLASDLLVEGGASGLEGFVPSPKPQDSQNQHEDT